MCILWCLLLLSVPLELRIHALAQLLDSALAVAVGELVGKAAELVYRRSRAYRADVALG